MEEKQGEGVIKKEVVLEDFTGEERKEYYSVSRISDGFVLNESDENETDKRITFYDNQGKKRFQIKNVKTGDVIGEQDGYYILGGIAAGGYIRKEDIKELNQKWVPIGEE